MWITETFKTNKPIVGMCHLDALPGDPYYDQQAGMKSVVEHAKEDMLALQNGGVDAILFSNEFSLPYLTAVKPETVAAMARVIGEIIHLIKIPYGVNVLWDPLRSLDLAVAVDAAFVREIFTGVYGSDFGLWNTNVGETIRHKNRIGGQSVKLLFNIVPEAASYLGNRDIVSIAKSTVFNNKPDGLCVSGLTAVVETDSTTLKMVVDAIAGKGVAVFANTGVRKENVKAQLSIADGAVVGTTFKKDGVFENHVDETRVKEFMNIVRQFRDA
jgi:membrane complex biogenesis BtpA family protein